MRICPHFFPLSDLKKEFCELMESLLRHKPVAFVWEVDPQLPLVWADRDKLCIILQNLLTNAAKFTAQGKIRLSAFPSPSRDKICLQIKDTGVGIASAHYEDIFETFLQVITPESPNPRGAEGSGIGIGLALARKLARMMDSDITVESKLGEGATFTLSLSVPQEDRRGNEVAFLHTALSDESSLPLASQPSLQPQPVLSL
jgi:signal transduction histidine kinase